MSSIPLAERLRPNTLDNFIGQNHLIGEKGILKNSIDNKVIPSIIFWGPPGVGKTTLANIIAKSLGRTFYTLSAINSSVKDVREVIEKANSLGLFGTDIPILFIDEIHRFSKSQQDSLLNAVEKGIVTLIGATTENPSFEVISALLSRCQVYNLEHLSTDNLKELLHQAISTDKILKNKEIILKETDSLLRLSGGDGRRLLNLFELVINSQQTSKITITNQLVTDCAQSNLVNYDKTGDQHYDIVSAFIKSIRGSDPNASVYWLARMIEGGEDVKFIARRMIILSSEDIGNANPTALVIANNCFQAVNVIGMPEARIVLAQTATYLACSAKSNSSYMAINYAQETVKETGSLSVPLSLRNAPTQLMKKMNYGAKYEYTHNYNGNFVRQEYMPEGLSKHTFYIPGENDKEKQFKKILSQRWNGKYKY